MSKNRHIARHRATPPSTMQVVSKAVSSHAGTVGRPAAVVVAASGIMFGAALPASAGTTTTSTATPAAEVSVQATAAPVAPAAPAAPAPAADAPAHTVQSGDTLGSIAANYGVSLDAVFAANGLGWDSVIYPGQVISLSGSAAAAPAPAAAPVQQIQVAAPAAAPAPQVQAAAVAPADTSNMGINLASSTNIQVADGASSGAGATVLASARAQLAAGTVQDCTRLVEIAMAAAGMPVGDLGPLQFADYGTRVSSPAPGDLVIRPGHVGIYAGGGQVISSGMNGANLTMEHPLSDLAGSFFVRL
ncbi:LysM peptidoglycan-binding domain-containing protein [uncultured Arthrobacter sp.]|uniref:C40 family peptidase n=1 Tax=uncultured Arthrobacter sp. TaxID=114050 RepID=UPI0026366EA7|nr:LysM peptidoglycan-binding domain-containing protein [uncultured Arthrobacter sp.]